MPKIVLLLNTMGLFACFAIGYLAGLMQPQSAVALPATATIMPADYIPAITIVTVESHRQAVVEYIFAGVLPDTMPVQDGDTLTVNLPHGFQSTVQLIHPAAPNGALVIYHAGHDGSEAGQYAEVASQFANAGYTVALMDMPLTGMNMGAVMSDVQHAGTMPITSHEQIAYLDDALRVFLEPVIAVVNWAESQGYQAIYMMGLSGGGWTTTLAAAIDTRIDASYPVAGSVPLGLRFDTPASWGDWEQSIPEFYQDIATYEDLYVLGSYGRRQLQILNSGDPCCFADSRYVLYEAAVQRWLADNGRFSVLWDSNTEHSISPAALAAILKDMQRDKAND